MKRFYLILLAFLFIHPGTFAQKEIKTEVTYTYSRLPKEPIGQGIKNYQTQVFVPNAEENAAAMAEYNRQLANANTKYETDMKQWELDKKAAQERYDKDMEEWNSKSGLTKIAEKSLLDEKKPVLIMPSEPYRQEPSKPVLKKEYDATALASYLKLDGYSRTAGNHITYTVNVQGFVKGEAKLESKASTGLVNGVSTNITKYWYVFTYHNPMTVKIQLPSGIVLWEEGIEKYNAFSSFKTPEYNSTGDLNRAYNSDTYYAQLEDKTLGEQLKEINEMVNSRFGFSKIERTTIVYNYESNNQNYDDLKLASIDAQDGYRAMDDKTESREKLTKAIDAWTKALEESDVESKKARINKEVTTGIRMNAAEACIQAGDFAGANSQLNKLLLVDLNKKDKEAIEVMRDFASDMEKRFKANQ